MSENQKQFFLKEKKKKNLAAQLQKNSAFPLTTLYCLWPNPVIQKMC